MKKIAGLDDLLCGLDGKPALDGDERTPLNERRPVTIGHLIANVLAGSQSAEPARAMSIAMRLYAGPGDLELEDADYTLVHEAIKSAPLANISKAAALAVLDGAESD